MPVKMSQPKAADSAPKDSEGAAPETPARLCDTVFLELVRIQRYLYRGRLFVRTREDGTETGAVVPYKFPSDDELKHHLQLRDPQGMSVFRVYKKRSAVIQRRRAEEELPEEVGPATTGFAAVVNQLSGREVGSTPGNVVDLSDDDPELLARLKALDDGVADIDTAGGAAGEFDTAVQV